MTPVLDLSDVDDIRAKVHFLTETFIVLCGLADNIQAKDCSKLEMEQLRRSMADLKFILRRYDGMTAYDLNI